MHTEFCVGKLNVRGHMEDLGIDGKLCVKIGHAVIRQDAMDRIHLAQDEDQCQALMNSATNLGVS
jgi:hypothetical protein